MSYIGTNSQHEISYNYTILQVDNTCSSFELFYTWNNLIQGEYQFSVVAFTSEGPGEASILMLSNNGKLVMQLMARYVSFKNGYSTNYYQ